MASDAAFFEVLEGDLRALSAEARKTDSLATQITGWLQHTDYPQIKECAERAVLKLRAVAHEGRGVEAVRTQEILRPFLLVCESKNPRLIGTVLGSIQKLLAHNAVSDEGRTQVIAAMQQVEKSGDDTVKLKILQTALTLLQNPHNVDDKDGAGQVLSICFRLYAQSRGSPKVVSTAAATIRQAVALLFDHTVAEQQAAAAAAAAAAGGGLLSGLASSAQFGGGGAGGAAAGAGGGTEGLVSGREMAAMLLLQDLMNMCAGHTPTWLKCPMVGRAFVLDLLEFVLLHRPAAFQSHSAFKVLLQSKLAPCLAGLTQTALDPEVEPAATGEAKLLLRCLGALLRKHALLLPDMSLTLIELLLAGCSASRMPWQRLLSLQVLRSLMADHQLLYVLFTTYDMSIHHDMNAVHDTLSVAVEAIKGYMKAAESCGPDDDMVASLSAIYSNRALGKDLQVDVDAHGPAQASMQEVWTVYLAIELLLAVVASVEVLTDAVSNTSSNAAPSDPMLLAPLAQPGGAGGGLDGVHSALSSSNSLVGLVRGNSMAGGTGTPRTPSASTIFNRSSAQSRFTPNSSPRGSTASLSTLGAAAGGGGSELETSAAAEQAAAARPNLRVAAATAAAAAAAGGQPPGAANTRPARAQSASLSAPVPAAHPGVAPLSAATLSTVVDVLWRPVLTGLSCALGHCRSRSSHESLMLVLLRAFQSYIFSAGALGEVPARDDFLKLLCEAAVTPAGVDEAGGGSSAEGQGLRVSNPSGALLDGDLAAAGGSAAGGSGASAGTGISTPGMALSSTQVTTLTLPGIGLKNIHCLRTVYNVAHRLADSLGSSWGLVVEVLYTLDRALPPVGPGSVGKDDQSFEPGTLTGELLILATAANQLFQSTQDMSPDAQASLMSALAQVSSRALAAASAQPGGGAGGAFMLLPSAAVSGGGVQGAAGGSVGAGVGAGVGVGGGGQVKLLPALNRMVEMLLYNLQHIQNLWPIFLTHLLEVLHSGNAVIRASGLEALDRCLTGAIAAPDLGQAAPSSQPAQQPQQHPGSLPSSLSLQQRRQQQPLALQQQQPQSDVAGVVVVVEEGRAADVEHMLLVALEGMYKEEREPDVRLGLLRVALHVLQRHGEALSRGWVPLLRLLEAVPAWEDGTTIASSYQCVESVCSDFLPTMPKLYIPKALEVVMLFAAQKSAINISLSAVGLMWNATDLLGRSRVAAAAAAAAASAAAAAAAAQAEQPTQQQPLQHSSSGVSSALGGIFSVLSLTRRPTAEELSAKAAAAAASATPGDSSQAVLSNGSGSPMPAAADGAADDSAAAAGAAASEAAAGAAAGSADDPHLAGRSDLSEEECTELLIKVFEHLRTISMDPRPEVRNSGIRTLFLAVGGQAGRFDARTWRHCLWEILFPLIQYAHVMGDLSSSEEAAAVELGKEKGKAVMMLVHHSRNTEQKQWDETTVLAFNGLGKVLRGHTPTVLAIPGIHEKWDDVSKIASQALMSGRKSVAVAAAQLLTGFLQGFKAPASSQSTPQQAPGGGATAAGATAATGAAGGTHAAAAGGLPSAAAGVRYPWRRTLTAIDEAVAVMAMPNTRVPLQARSELLNGLSAAYTAQASEGVFDVSDMQLLLRWLDMLARNPKGADDVKAVTGVLPPVQKLVLQLLGQLNMALLPDAWPHMLRTLAGFLCPFRAMTQRQQQEAMAATAAAAAAAAAATPGGGTAEQVAASGLRTPRVGVGGGPSGSPQQLGLPGARSLYRLLSVRPGGPVPAAATDAAQLSSQWMAKVTQRLVELYAHAPWQVRATLFGPVVQGLSECAALRYITPEDGLWQQAAAGLTSVIQAGLPAVNIMFVNHAQQPENAWQVLAGAFETFLLGEGLPGGLLLLAAQQQQQQLSAAAAGDVPQQQQPRTLHHSSSSSEAAAGAAAGPAGASFPHSGSMHVSSGSQQQLPRSAAVDAAEEAALQRAVLDALTEQVLASCSSAAHEQRSRLVRVLVVGAGSTLGHTCTCSSSGSSGDPNTTAGAAAGSVACCCGEPDQRFSQMCLRRLSLLTNRGTDGQAGSVTAVLLGVAQIALPQLIGRCRAVLQAYAELEQAALTHDLQQQQQPPQQGLPLQADAAVAGAVQQQGQQLGGGEGAGQAASLGLQQQCLVDEVLCVLHVLLELQLDVAVFEHLLEHEPSVAACIAAVQHAQLVHQQLQQQQHHHQQQQQPLHASSQQQQQQQQSPQKQPLPQQQHQQQQVLTHPQQQQMNSQPQDAAQQPRRQSVAAVVDLHRHPNSSSNSNPAGSDGGSSSSNTSRRHQGHLLLLYNELSQCVGCRDRRVGVLVRAALQAAGRQLGL